LISLPWEQVLKKISRNVYLLGCLSFFNDFTSEMISPLLPVYLAAMGLGAGFLGIMEGLANFFSYLMMLLSGLYADRRGQNKRITLFGYRLCAFVRPLIAIPSPVTTLLARLVDRIGKGIRTAPRDRLITASEEKESWGKAFGVQRALDHAGSLSGAGIAALFLSVYSQNLSLLFLGASIPAILSILIVPRWIQDIPVPLNPNPISLSWTQLPPPLRPYIIVIFLSAISTPSELFLMLRMQELGMKTFQIPLLWIVMTLFKLFSSYLGGHLADRWSRRMTIGGGWFFFTAVYVGFAYNTNLLGSWFLIAAYGFHAGIVEASERAYPATMAREEARAAALGWYYFAYGIGLLPASILFGILWKLYHAQGAFLIFAALTFLTIPLLAFLPSDRPERVKPAP
jgi:MFS family permease